jgi:Icc-related predicted phosphoesterase
MKLLAFSDIHGDYSLLKQLVKRAKKSDIDIVVCAGDITDMGSGLKKFVATLDAIGKPVIIVHGNHESADAVKEIAEQTTYCVPLHGNHYVSHGIIFLGYGGDGFSERDAEFRKVARRWRQEFADKKVVLITHGQPYGTTLDALDKRHVGNWDYRKFIERVQPLLVISGHIHETIGARENIGKTIIINPCWEGMVIELG